MGKKVLRGVLIALGVILVLVYLVLPFGFGAYAVMPSQKAVGAPPPGFSEIQLMTEDEITLAAWYAPPQNDAVIILVPGAHGTRAGMRDYAAMLMRHGFGILSLDLRGNGESEGGSNQFGWAGTRDIGAAVQFLQAQPDVTAIGGLGTSLGGEVLLGAASTYPAIRAIASDGASYRSVAEYTDLDYQRPLHRNFTMRVMYLAVWLLSGDEPPLPICDSIVDATNTHFLLIAGRSNNTEVDYNEMFTATIGDRAALWIVPGAGHTQAFGKYPQEYEERVIAFFEANLLG